VTPLLVPAALVIDIHHRTLSSTEAQPGTLKCSTTDRSEDAIDVGVGVGVGVATELSHILIPDSSNPHCINNTRKYCSQQQQYTAGYL
jgi:hypothetical protein